MENIICALLIMAILVAIVYGFVIANKLKGAQDYYEYKELFI